MAAPKKTGLGKGLDALFQDNRVEEKSIVQLKISQIEPNANQPRSHFDESALRELADSIRTHGVLQPLVVRAIDGGNYQIVAGERRWRASRIAGLTEVPVVIKELTDSQTLEIGIIENLQREDLNPVELALGYQTLMEQYDMTQEEVAEKVGKSRPVVANTIRLLRLPQEVLEMLKNDEITSGHARALVALEDESLIQQTASRIIKEGLLVRDIEKIAQESKKEADKKVNKRSSRPNIGWGNSFYKEMELALSSELGRKVNISQKDGKATVSFEFYDKEELENFIEKFLLDKNAKSKE